MFLLKIEKIPKSSKENENSKKTTSSTRIKISTTKTVTKHDFSENEA